MKHHDNLGISKRHNSTARHRSTNRGTIPKMKTLAPDKTENGMLVGLCRRRTRRDHLLLICQATVPTLMVLMTAVSCSAPTADMPQPRHRVIDRELPPSSRWTNEESQQLAQRGLDRRSILRWEQQRTSALSRVAKARAPDTTGASVSRRILRKPNPPPPLDAHAKERLFQEFLEWQRRQRDIP